jgi:LAS superfamily LD-carboxypeptidase LdcB
MAKISNSLISSIKSKVLGKTDDESSPSKITKDNNSLLKIIAQNTMSIAGLARDLNVARQNAAKLVKLEGGEPTNKADAHFLKQSEREAAVEAQREESQKPSAIIDKSKELFTNLKEQFSKNKILQSITKFIAIGAVVTIIFFAIKDSLIEWAKGLYETIKTKFEEFTDNIKQWFQDSIQTIIDKSKEIITKIIDTVTSFFSKIGNWFGEKFETIKNIFEEPLAFVKQILDKVFGVIQFLSDKVKGLVEGAKKIGGAAVSGLKKVFGRKTKEEPVETETVRREEETKKQAQEIEVAPSPEAIFVPGPAPEPVAKKTTQPVEPTPPPIKAEPPTAVGKAAEPPGKQVSGGSLASVASVQSGVDLSGLHPEFEKRLVTMATAFKEETGKKLLVTSGTRSNERQAELFKAKVAELGGNEAAAAKLVARPMPPLGTGRGSFHLKGLAIDVNSKGPAGINVLAGDRENPTGWLEKFGLIRNVPRENWHIQPAGTLPTPDNPENPGAPTLVAGKDGKPMNLTDSKKESLPEPKTTAASGGEVSQASNDVSVGQRQQTKSETPIIINAPTTNNKVVQNNQTSPAQQKTDTNRRLLAQAA